MEQPDNQTRLIQLLTLAGNEGLTGEILENTSRQDNEIFNVAAEQLWNTGQLVGLKENGCCGNQCGSACVSYMKAGRVWRLA